jgi:hypothetical protein
MALPPVFADFNNADARGRLRLSTVGSLESLARSGLKLTDGLAIRVHDDDELEADGVATFSTEEGIWVATIDWNAIRQIGQPTRSR